MGFESKDLLLGLLLATYLCCYLAAPLGKKNHLIEATLPERNREETTQHSSSNEPIKILRSTDHDIIIQIRRTPYKESNDEGFKDNNDELDLSDESIYNKHIKSKIKSSENPEQTTDDNKDVGKEIVKDRISRISMHRLPSTYKSGSKELRFKDINKSFKHLAQTEILDKENEEDKIKSTESNFSGNRRTREQALNDGKNKRELNARNLNISENNSPREIIIDLKRNLHFDESKDKAFNPIKSENREHNSPETPKPPKTSFRTISLRRNDVKTTERPERERKNELYDDEYMKSLLPPKFPSFQHKLIQIRSPQIDSLQDLKRKLKIDHSGLLPQIPVLLPRRDAPQIKPFGLPGIQQPSPSGQYSNLPLRPITVPPPEDPILQAERAKAALQRMILFVNAMGKFDYYVSNAARNFVDLMTHHTRQYDDTVKSRLSGKDKCEGKRDADDDDDDDDDSRDEYVRVRKSKSRKPSQDYGGRKNVRTHEYGW